MTGTLFPASAGMNRNVNISSAEPRTVPRVRGDEPSDQLNADDLIACSPRPRG